jgi:hypothetical protein
LISINQWSSSRKAGWWWHLLASVLYSNLVKSRVLCHHGFRNKSKGMGLDWWIIWRNMSRPCWNFLTYADDCTGGYFSKDLPNEVTMKDRWFGYIKDYDEGYIDRLSNQFACKLPEHFRHDSNTAGCARKMKA